MARPGHCRSVRRTAGRPHCEADPQAPTPEAVESPTADPHFLHGDVDLDSRTIYLRDIDGAAAAVIIKGLSLMEEDCDFPIHLIINSRGGDWCDGLAIYDAIKSAGVPVTCEVIGRCMSMAVVIAQACTHRFIHPNANVMVHNGSAAVEDNLLNVEAYAAYNKSERKRMYRLLAEKTGKRPAYWARRLSKCDLFLNAEQAVKAGLFDEVIVNT